MGHGIYVHVPWCRVVCPYCAFAVVADPAPGFAAWLDGVLRDHALVADAFPSPAETLYLGGGTPSLLPLPTVAALLDALPRAPGAEVSVEVNPGTVDLAYLRGLVDRGVTRLSLGIQTFQTPHARRLARGHDVRQAEHLVGHMAELGLQSWSLDLMFALPGQRKDELDADLDRVLDLQPPHVSLYGLTYEPGTPFHERRQRGRLVEAEPELWRQMYERIVERLQAAGWERYEVSNFARPGHRSRHNEATWRGGTYAGLGPSAHGYLPPDPQAPFGRRTVAASELSAWQDGPWAQVELLDARTSALDLLLSTLRHIDGLPLPELARRGYTLAPRVLEDLDRAGLVELGPQTLRLRPHAFALADGLTRVLAAGLRTAGAGPRTAGAGPQDA